MNEEKEERKLSKFLLEKEGRKKFNLMEKRLNYNGRSVATPEKTNDTKDKEVRLKKIIQNN